MATLLPFVLLVKTIHLLVERVIGKLTKIGRVFALFLTLKREGKGPQSRTGKFLLIEKALKLLMELLVPVV